jgi:hypothetical protein
MSMCKKRYVITALVGLNLFLLAVLLIGSYSLPAAQAQAGGRAGDFLTVTVLASGQAYDVLYVVDVPKRKMYAFVPDATSIDFVGYTDLKKDFRP